MIINLLICFFTILCTVIVCDTIHLLRESKLLANIMIIFKRMSDILTKAEEVDRLLDGDGGEYIANGYLLEDEDYFEICRILEDIMEVNK